MLEPIALTLAYFAVATAIILITVYVFVGLTRYNDWEEIKKGNLAAGMTLGGKIFGVGNILHFAIRSNDTLIQTTLWGIIGLILLMLVYLLYEWLTPNLNVNEEIGSGNKAVGFISMAFSITFSFIIGACIS